MSIAQKIKEKLSRELSPLRLNIIDESYKHAGHAGARPQGESHFHVEIVSEAFENLSRVARQRLIFQILKEEMDTDIHALTMTAKTPPEE